MNIEMNIALNIVSQLIVLVILYSSVIHKHKEHAQNSFIFWNVNLVSLLICELLIEAVAMWMVDSPDNAVPLILHRILFVLDFFLYNMLPVSYYRYISSFLSPSTRQKEIIKVGHRVSKINVVIFTLIFATSLYTGWFYTIDPYGYEYYKWGYLILELVVLLNWHLQLIPLRIYRSQYGRKKAFALSIYVWIPLLLLPFDYIFNLTLSYTAYAVETLFIYVGFDIQQTKERALLEADIALKDKKMKDMQVELMMAQIHPHFLYNTLSTISCLCRQDPIEAEAATKDFSNYLKANLSSINSTKPIPFSKELLHAESYLNIQKRRFPDTLKVEYDVKVRDFTIPSLSLQTVVENAIKHAVETRYEPTTVKISTEETDTCYLICVEDDGPGFDTNAIDTDSYSDVTNEILALSKSDRPHIGIKNTQERLKEMSDGNLLITSQPGKGTRVTITIPKKEKHYENTGSR